ncbi:MAG: twin-arginine translocase subunit TatC [Candidatus Eiseniibacteriota bacterium]
MDSDKVKRQELAGGEMTLFEHLAELRRVLLQSIVAVGLASVGAWFLAERALDLMIGPALGPGERLVFLSPSGAFMLRVKTALGLGLFLAAPIVVWRLWSFVVPGLLRKERGLLLPVVVSSVFLFYAGALFAHLLVVPMSVRFLLGFGSELIQPMIEAERYFQFVLRSLLAFGLVFQFPLVVAVLTWWDVLSPDFLRRYWRHGVVLVFVVSAVLTPPDVASQLLMAAPVLVLYVVSMVLAHLIARSRRGRDQST